MNAPDRYGQRKVPRMYANINTLRAAIRAEGTPAIQEAWDAVEEHIDFAYSRDPAVILAAALELPEVKALVEAVEDAVCAWHEHQKNGDPMEGWWVSGAQDALAALKGDDHE